MTLLVIFMIGFCLALNAEISTEVDSETSNFVLETSSSASSGFDAYDVEVPNYPDNTSAQLSSVVSGKNLMLDAFSEESDRTLNLVYEIGSSVNESEDITFTWDSDDFDGYEASLKDYGNDSSRGSTVTTSDLDSLESFQVTNTYNTRYFTIELVYQEASSPAAPDTGGGGGGGGGGSVAADENVKLSLSELNFNLVSGRVRYIGVNVTNLADVSKNISVSQTNLQEVLTVVDSSIEFGPGETKEVVLTFFGPEETGVFAGIVYIGGNPILTTVNVRSTELLFDAMIVVPDSSKKVDQGDKLSTQVTLIPMGDEDVRVDVTLNYIIKDFDGNVYLIESETILVDSQKSFKKEFSLGNLVNGNYLVALELVYPNGVATSSSHFSVLDESLIFSTEIMIIAGTIIVILFILILWRVNLTVGKRKRSRKK
tara:strand:- start:7018 stop:8298 length:1281 start_codon:yes stop_codon:yes gene_type:complete